MMTKKNDKQQKLNLFPNTMNTHMIQLVMTVKSLYKFTNNITIPLTKECKHQNLKINTLNRRINFY